MDLLAELRDRRGKANIIHKWDIEHIAYQVASTSGEFRVAARALDHDELHGTTTTATSDKADVGATESERGGSSLVGL